MHWRTKNICVTRFSEIFALLLWSRTEPVISPKCEKPFKNFDTEILFQVRNYNHVPTETDDNRVGRA